jgi:hypothetical protein
LTRAAGAVVAFVVVLMGFRLWRAPLESYGDSAAQYIEHLARVRMLDRVQQSESLGLLDGLVYLDGLYPPGLHLVELAWGVLFGHSAESVVWLGLGWWALLAVSIGVLGRRLAPEVPSAGMACFVAMALVPAAQGAALRSYYDLPMTALLWAGLAVISGPVGMRGLWAGLLFVGAVLIKWTALPYAIIMVVAWMIAGGGSTWRSGLTAMSVVGTWTVVYLGAGAESFFTMGSATFQPPPGVELSAGLASGPERWLGALRAGLGELGMERLGFYPTRLATTVLSPVGAVLVVVAWVRMVRQRQSGSLFVGLLGLGLLAFVVLMVPPLDDRFILTLAPGLALVAGLGLVGSGRLGTLAVAAMLFVSADAHLWPSAGPKADGDRWPQSREGRVFVPRLGMSSSVDRRGWSRSADHRSDKTALREALWETLVGCGGGVVATADKLISPSGDLNWWTYRRVLAEVSQEDVTVRWVGEPGAKREKVRLWVGFASSGAGPVLHDPPRGWVSVADVADETGRSLWRVYGPKGSASCQ